MLKGAPFFKSHRDLVTPVAGASTILMHSLKAAEPRRGYSWVLEGMLTHGSFLSPLSCPSLLLLGAYKYIPLPRSQLADFYLLGKDGRRGTQRNSIAGVGEGTQRSQAALEAHWV